MIDFSCLQAAKESGDYHALIDCIPYARLLGVVMQEDAQGPLFVLPYAQRNIGNVHVPALHGGVMGGFMENAALLHLVWARESSQMPRTVDFALDFLRPGRAQALYTRCEIIRQGKRIAHVGMSAWQDDPAKPVAVARAHFLLS